MAVFQIEETMGYIQLEIMLYVHSRLLFRRRLNLF